MDSNKKDITLEARRQEKNRNEKVRKIEEQLNSSQNDEPTYKGPIQMFQEKITDDFKTIEENLDKLVPVFQDDELEVNLLFWISLAILAALLGIPFIFVLIAGHGLVKLLKKQKDQTLVRIDEDGNWVYGGGISNI